MNPRAVAIAVGLTTLALTPSSGQAPDRCAVARTWTDTTPWPRWVVSNADAALLRRIIKRTFVPTGGDEAERVAEGAAQAIRDSLGATAMPALLALMTDPSAEGTLPGRAAALYLDRLGFPLDSADRILRSPGLASANVMDLIVLRIKETAPARWPADTGIVAVTCSLARGFVEGWEEGLPKHERDYRRALLADVLFALRRARGDGDVAARTLLEDSLIDRVSSRLQRP